MNATQNSIEPFFIPSGKIIYDRTTGSTSQDAPCTATATDVGAYSQGQVIALGTGMGIPLVIALMAAIFFFLKEKTKSSDLKRHISIVREESYRAGKLRKSSTWPVPHDAYGAWTMERGSARWVVEAAGGYRQREQGPFMLAEGEVWEMGFRTPTMGGTRRPSRAVGVDGGLAPQRSPRDWRSSTSGSWGRGQSKTSLVPERSPDLKGLSRPDQSLRP